MFLYDLVILMLVFRYSQVITVVGDVSLNLKFLSSYGYIPNLVLFIISLEDSHFGSKENMLVSHQNKS